MCTREAGVAPCGSRLHLLSASVQQAAPHCEQETLADRVPQAGDALMAKHFAKCPNIFENTQPLDFRTRTLSGSSLIPSPCTLIYFSPFGFMPLTVTNGTSHSPTALNGAPSPPNGFSNGPSSSSSSSLANQQLPPACGARQLSKLKRFLTTLQQFGNDISPEIGERVRTLVLGLVVSAQKSVFWDTRPHVPWEWGR